RVPRDREPGPVRRRLDGRDRADERGGARRLAERSRLPGIHRRRIGRRLRTLDHHSRTTVNPRLTPARRQSERSESTSLPSSPCAIRSALLGGWLESKPPPRFEESVNPCIARDVVTETPTTRTSARGAGLRCPASRTR